MTDSLVVVDVAGGIARMRLNRPSKRNAISEAMAREIQEAMAVLDAADDVRVIVVEGSSGAFSAGADMVESLAATEAGDRRFNPAAEACGRVAASPKPTLAAVEGPAYGAGALLACACDIRVITEEARFRFPGSEYGLVVGAAGLAGLIGPALAKELIYTSRAVNAEEALRIGLANRVVPAHELASAVEGLASAIAAASPLAAAWAKRVIDASPGKAEILEAKADLVLRGGPDHRTRFARATERITGQGAAGAGGGS